jgi:DNA-binding transcriptional LysR family regulator
MDRLQGIEAFVRVAQTHSYSEAARLLGVAKSVVTTRIQQLEESIGTPLLVRNTRSVSLSQAGQAFYEECAQVVGRASELVDQMRDLSGAPSGVLKVHALPGFVLGHFGDLLGRFQNDYPGITLDLVISDAVVDPVREGYDCVLQIFEPVSDALVARKLFAWRGVFCAAPAYLMEQGTPEVPGDLVNHRLGLYSRYPTRDRWVFRNGMRQEELLLKPCLRTNSVHLLRDYACAGHGIVCIPTFVASEDLLSGRLQVVLPDHDMPTFWLSAVYPAAQRGQLKLKLFLESLAASPGDDPPWDKPLIARGLIARSTELRGPGAA